MGSSPSIKQMEEKQTEFDSYRKKLQTELSAEATKTVEKMEAEVKQFYTENGWKGQAFLAGTSYDFMQQHEWSLANVKSVLEAICKAMLGQQANPPSGVTVTPVEEASQALKDMGNLELYLVGKAFQVIAGVIESFGSSSEVKFKGETAHKPLGNGFHLFLSVSQNSYRTREFFDNEAIYEYLYVYQLRFCHEEALQQAEIEMTELYEDEIAVYKKKSEEALAKFGEEKMSATVFGELKRIYSTLIAEAEALLKKLGAQKTAALTVRV